MGIVMVGVANTDMDRHISKIFSKTKKLIVCLKLRHFKSHCIPSKNVFSFSNMFVMITISTFKILRNFRRQFAIIFDQISMKK